MPVTEHDREIARAVMIAGSNKCKRTYALLHDKSDELCDCDLGAIDGCKARVEAIAEAVAAVRNPFEK